MSQYLIRKNKHKLELAKFEDSDRPIDVYTIADNKCNCPSRYANCKHKKLAVIWQKDGSPIGNVYNDSGSVIGSIF